MNGSSPLAVSPPPKDAQGTCPPAERAPASTQPAGALISDAPASRPVQKKCLLFKPPRLLPSRLRQGSKKKAITTVTGCLLGARQWSRHHNKWDPGSAAFDRLGSRGSEERNHHLEPLQGRTGREKREGGPQSRRMEHPLAHTSMASRPASKPMGSGEGVRSPQ